VGGRFAPADIRRQLERSLRRLGRDSVDIVLLHEVDARSAPLGLETLGFLRDAGLLRLRGIGTGALPTESILTSFVPDVVQLAARDVVDTRGAALVLHSVLAGRTEPAVGLLRDVASSHPDAVILVGSRNPAHIREAAAALG